jgi:hypothetical protein
MAFWRDPLDDLIDQLDTAFAVPTSTSWDPEQYRRFQEVIALAIWARTAEDRARAAEAGKEFRRQFASGDHDHDRARQAGTLRFAGGASASNRAANKERIG